MYLCESCGIWINCSIHRLGQWQNYLNKPDIQHDCPRRCQQVCSQTNEFRLTTGWRYNMLLMETTPTNFQPFHVAPIFQPDLWQTTSSSLYIGNVSDNAFY